MVIFPSNTSYFSLYNYAIYGLGHPTLCVNLSDSSGLDHPLGSTVIAVFTVRRCLIPRIGVDRSSLASSRACMHITAVLL